MNVAATCLLALVFGLVVYDWATHKGTNRRALWVESAVFVAGAFFIAFPARATSLAHLVGIGRGVDFLLYPIVIWLVRESLLARRLRFEDGERMTELARAVALRSATRVSSSSAHSSSLNPTQSEADSASLRT
jgi:small membrane protein